MCQLQLHHHALLAAEKMFTAEKIELPHADEARTITVFNRGSVMEKPEASVLQRPSIMTAHHFHIGDVQAPPVGRANELFYRGQMHPGIYIL